MSTRFRITRIRYTRLEEELNQYPRDGWGVHSITFEGMGIYTILLERQEIQNNGTRLMDDRPRLSPEQISFYKSKGYRRISRKYGIISRIDRPDWRKYMVNKGMENCINSSEFYVRVLSKDKIELHPEDALQFESASSDMKYIMSGYDEVPVCSLCGQEMNHV